MTTSIATAGLTGPDVHSKARQRSIEWPTFAVAGCIYGAFGLVTWFHAILPVWALILIGGYLVAWHGSLQHEVVHGHPTRWPLLNRLLVLPSLWLLMPYGTYRESHLKHHEDERLTDPLEDPESYYLTDERWRRLGRLGRAFHWVYNTLAGRMALFPFVIGLCALRDLMRGLAKGDRETLTAWAAHGLGVGIVFAWVVGVCGLAVVEYLAFFVYPGLALTSLRSFAEHRAHPEVESRTAVVEAEWPLALMFLNNNLHIVHHDEPGLPWYRIPARWRERKARAKAHPGERFSSYAEVALRWLLWPKEAPVHPATTGDASGSPC